VEAVERTAVDFLAERLDAGNERHYAGNAYMYASGGYWARAVGQELGLAVQEYRDGGGGVFVPGAASSRSRELVESDELGAKEEEVFEWVMDRVKEDEAGRQA
jgi:hypothetical protein